MVTALRWIAAIPVGAIAAIAAHFLLGFMLSLGNGFETVASFWAASGMNGMPITGTLILVATRFSTAAAFVAAIVCVVPKFQTQAGVAAPSLVCLAAFAFLMFVVWAVMQSGDSVSIGGWYRAIVEFVSLAGGSAIGARVAYADRE
jgi:hypothetical protein